jgi:hypothetical protein
MLLLGVAGVRWRSLFARMTPSLRMSPIHGKSLKKNKLALVVVEHRTVTEMIIDKNKQFYHARWNHRCTFRSLSPFSFLIRADLRLGFSFERQLRLYYVFWLSHAHTQADRLRLSSRRAEV